MSASPVLTEKTAAPCVKNSCRATACQTGPVCQTGSACQTGPVRLRIFALTAAVLSRKSRQTAYGYGFKNKGWLRSFDERQNPGHAEGRAVRPGHCRRASLSGIYTEPGRGCREARRHMQYIRKSCRRRRAQKRLRLRIAAFIALIMMLFAGFLIGCGAERAAGLRTSAASAAVTDLDKL